MNLQDVSDAFNLQASPELLSGGSHPTFKVGNVVLKCVQETFLENNHSPELIQWIAEFSQALKQDGFRFPKALLTKEGHGSLQMDGSPGQLLKEDTQPKKMS